MDDIYQDRFVGVKPAWHRKGITFGARMTAADAIREAKLDIPVGLSQMTNVDGDVVPKRFTTVRLDMVPGTPGRVLGQGMRTGYEVVQNVDLFTFFDAVISVDEAVYVSAGILGSTAARIFIVAELAESMWVEKEQYRQYIVLHTGHTGRYSIQAMATTVQVVCANTYQMALRDVRKTGGASVRIRHTSNALVRLQEAHEIIGLSNQHFQDTEQLFQALARRRVTSTVSNDFVQALFGSRPEAAGEDASKRTREKRDAVLAAKAANPNERVRRSYWGLVAATSEVVDHQPSLFTRRPDDVRFALTSGTGVVLKQKALALAIEMSGVQSHGK